MVYRTAERWEVDYFFTVFAVAATYFIERCVMREWR